MLPGFQRPPQKDVLLLGSGALQFLLLSPGAASSARTLREQAEDSMSLLPEHTAVEGALCPHPPLSATSLIFNSQMCHVRYKSSPLSRD